MRASELFDELKRRHSLGSDSQVARVLGLTQGRVSQLRNLQQRLSARQVVSLMGKAAALAGVQAFQRSIRPVVEMYPIKRTRSRQEVKWELLPTNKNHVRNRAIRECLEGVQGLYILYDSLGCAIYAGKTEKQNLWKELTNAFNRQRSDHMAFFVKHPTNGTSFSPAWLNPRQPIKRLVYLYDTAHYFSAYEVAPPLIQKLEAFVVRAFCNSMSNKKMEKF